MTALGILGVWCAISTPFALFAYACCVAAGRADRLTEQLTGSGAFLSSAAADDCGSSVEWTRAAPAPVAPAIADVPALHEVI